jgi:DNA-binding PadR family transcriptional regulator
VTWSDDLAEHNADGTAIRSRVRRAGGAVAAASPGGVYSALKERHDT